MTKAQEVVCKKFNSPYLPIAGQEMVALAVQTIGKMPIYGVRVIKEHPDDIEWFIHCGEFSGEDDFYKPIHASHLSEMLPAIEKYLALSQGFKFIIDDSGYEDVWQDFPEEGDL
ncbi:hypothetical protein [Aquitalea magnusonii]|uniref:immunity protein Imm33 domain-containing protein n=1 Tax=Aquitalea magnusonii TaxID=332411 RepID=UPI0018D4FFCF|nr:hypothetical protein [Aquitalea magnusonii]